MSCCNVDSKRFKVKSRGLSWFLTYSISFALTNCLHGLITKWLLQLVRQQLAACVSLFAFLVRPQSSVVSLAVVDTVPLFQLEFHWNPLSWCEVKRHVPSVLHSHSWFSNNSSLQTNSKISSLWCPETESFYTLRLMRRWRVMQLVLYLFPWKCSFWQNTSL